MGKEARREVGTVNMATGLAENAVATDYADRERRYIAAGSSRFQLLLWTALCMIPQIIVWLAEMGDVVDEELARRKKYQQ